MLDRMNKSSGENILIPSKKIHVSITDVIDTTIRHELIIPFLSFSLDKYLIIPISRPHLEKRDINPITDAIAAAKPTFSTE